MLGFCCLFVSPKYSNINTPYVCENAMSVLKMKKNDTFTNNVTSSTQKLISLRKQSSLYRDPRESLGLLGHQVQTERR